MKSDRHTQAIYPYYGLGFQVNLLDVPLIELAGEWVPDVNFNRIEDHFAYVVPLKPDPLTGYEVRFLRRHLGLTLDAWASILSVTRQCVMKWEKFGDKPTGMAATTEKLLRMYVLRGKGLSPSLFQQVFDALFDKKRFRRSSYEINARHPLTGANYVKKMLNSAPA